MKQMLAVLIAAGSAALSVAAQSPGSAGTSPAAKAWKVPRLPDGTPDLQGVWGNNAVTPMTRPTQWKDKTSLTDAEVQELRGLAARYVDQGKDAIFGDFVQLVLDAKSNGKFNQTSYDPTTGNYNQFWMSDREWDNRTSLIIDPPNGQFPPLTPDGEARRAAFLRAVQEGTAGSSENGPAGRADGPEDRPLTERCISYGAPWTCSWIRQLLSNRPVASGGRDSAGADPRRAHHPDRRRPASAVRPFVNCMAIRAVTGTRTRWSSKPRITAAAFKPASAGRRRRTSV